MKKNGLILIGMLISMGLKAEPVIKVGDLAYSKRIVPLISENKLDSTTLGIVKVTDIRSDGTVVVSSEKLGFYEFTRKEADELLRANQCPLTGKRAYSNEKRRWIIDNYISSPSKIGYGVVLANFGPCDSGVASFKADRAESAVNVDSGTLVTKVESLDLGTKRVGAN